VGSTGLERAFQRKLNLEAARWLSGVGYDWARCELCRELNLDAITGPRERVDRTVEIN
jgi:hypothetical protein